MLVGILSDTHDRIEAAAAAVAYLQRAGAEYFIHCGDVGDEHVLDCLAGLRSAFVFGNNDWDRRTLERYAGDIGVRCLGVFGELELGGKRFAIHHGDDLPLSRRLMTGHRYDYILQGHTHLPSDERVDNVRLINPGALHRARPKTVALLDTATDKLTFHEMPDEPMRPTRRRSGI